MHPEIERVVLDKVARGDYRSVAELIEEALYLLVERDWAACQADLNTRMPSAFDFPDDPPGERETP